jgi:hypothetical protein
MKNKYKIAIFFFILVALFIVLFCPINPSMLPNFIYDLKCKLHIKECHTFMHFNKKEFDEFTKSYENAPKYNSNTKDNK